MPGGGLRFDGGHRLAEVLEGDEQLLADTQRLAQGPGLCRRPVAGVDGFELVEQCPHGLEVEADVTAAYGKAWPQLGQRKKTRGRCSSTQRGWRATAPAGWRGPLGVGGSRGGAFDLEDEGVGVAPPPVLTGLVGADEGMAGVLAVVGGGVAVG